MINALLITGSVALMGVSLWLSRSQHFVDDTDDMKGMVPHHSIAILTSERADIDDIATHSAATSAADAQQRPVPAFTSDNVRKDCPGLRP